MKMLLRKFSSLILCLTLAAAVAAAPVVSFAAEEAEPQTVAADEGELVEDPLQEEIEVSTDGIPDNDELLTQYVENLAAEEAGTEIHDPAGSDQQDAKRSGPRKAAGARLTGNNKIIYDGLKAEIQKIAAGKRSSTEIQVPIEGLNKSNTLRYASDLGLSSTVSNGGISTEAKRKYLEDVLNFDSSLILDALMVDCPYELYWYDKTALTFNSVANKIRTDKNGTWINFDYTEFEHPVIEFYMPVSSDYSASGNTHTYRVDTDKARLATDSASNAAAIVIVNEDKSDYIKLQEYRKAICQMTSYNRNASPNDDYGDPWQLIYVFDGDPLTRVMCEGYSKAFQLLCDLTEFRSSELECRTAWGTMSGGPHMWNIMHMENGNNYLVDVTNCDSGTIGSPDKLFLKGYSSRSGDSYTFRQALTSLVYKYYADMYDLYTSSDVAISSSDYVSSETYTDDEHVHSFTSPVWTLGPALSGYSVVKHYCTKCGIAERVVYTTEVSGLSSKTWTGKARKCEPVLSIGGYKLEKGVDYEFSISNNVDVGKATVKITGIGDFEGSSRTCTFKILPKKSKVRKLTGKKKGFTIKWKRVATKMSSSRITGYQVQCALNKNFSKGKKSVKIKGYTKTSKKITGLKSGKKYYVRVRTYMTVKGKTYYSDWSSAKRVRTK